MGLAECRPGGGRRLRGKASGSPVFISRARFSSGEAAAAPLLIPHGVLSAVWRGSQQGHGGADRVRKSRDATPHPAPWSPLPVRIAPTGISWQDKRTAQRCGPLLVVRRISRHIYPTLRLQTPKHSCEDQQAVIHHRTPHIRQACGPRTCAATSGAFHHRAVCVIAGGEGREW